MEIVRLFNPTEARGVLFIALTLVALFYLAAFVRTARAINGDGTPGSTDARPTPARIAVGAVTNFFDTLGIGSFATTTSIFRFWKMVPDELIPGTLNVGHTMGAITQTYIYTRLVPVEATTLVSMIVAAVCGSWLGAGIVSGWPRRRIQVGMGFCLVGAASLMLLSQLGWLPGGGEMLGVSGAKLGIAVGVNFVLGALMTLGIGLYAPCLILVSLLGMNPTAGFPIMMGSCAFLMPVSSARFMQKRAFHLGAALGLAIGSIPAVLLAAFWVRSMSLDAMRWLVIVVVLYTAIGMLLAARREAPPPVAAGA